jgi:FKBP-type peptidyl-prolyl cis-trans isomerase
MVHAMHKSMNRLLQACSLMTLSAAPLWASAQTPAPQTTAPITTPATPPPAAPSPPTREEGSYMIGINLGQSLHQLGVTDEVSLETLERGLNDGLGGKRLEPGEQRRLQAFVHSIVNGVTTRNKAAAKEFLDKNGREKGVKTTASGLQYKVLAAGDAKAAAPTRTDQVTVQYRGTLLDGSEFDSSFSRGTPATFMVNGVIKGWQEALVLMKPGARWQVWVPPELGYDASPRPGIPSGSLLAFDVELLNVKPTPPAPPAPPPEAPAKSTP